jgi:hypothetical protein
LEQVGLVGLADVDELLGGPHGVLVDPDQLALDLDQPLGGDDREVGDTDAVQDSEPLDLGLPLGGVGLLGELGAAEPELAPVTISCWMKPPWVSPADGRPGTVMPPAVVLSGPGAPICSDW